MKVARFELTSSTPTLASTAVRAAKKADPSANSCQPPCRTGGTSIALSTGPGIAEETHPVTIHDPRNVRLAVAALPQQVGESLKVGDGVEVERRLLLAEA